MIHTLRLDVVQDHTLVELALLGVRHASITRLALVTATATDALRVLGGLAARLPHLESLEFFNSPQNAGVALRPQVAARLAIALDALVACLPRLHRLTLPLPHNTGLYSAAAVLGALAGCAQLRQLELSLPRDWPGLTPAYLRPLCGLAHLEELTLRLASRLLLQQPGSGADEGALAALLATHRPPKLRSCRLFALDLELLSAEVVMAGYGAAPPGAAGTAGRSATTTATATTTTAAAPSAAAAQATMATTAATTAATAAAAVTAGCSARSSTPGATGSTGGAAAAAGSWAIVRVALTCGHRPSRDGSRGEQAAVLGRLAASLLAAADSLGQRRIPELEVLVWNRSGAWRPREHRLLLRAGEPLLGLAAACGRVRLRQQCTCAGRERLPLSEAHADAVAARRAGE
ncbi:hypothetical protein HYH02_008693 [Chlamydomonas schloesseri]|uniref:Uncharacterized protein n=1 Tax=Chlamydomonas schloesseri TaxID=2026947 RepID=A0A835WD37_9CHLO|nr:hypothetical protein HYH02_008693 [Chlamydomonas schloesseri]|eukprot:KAG2445225.1 hypothetical protein HYH02_008693 [Chlamydomonas schloesseri]